MRAYKYLYYRIYAWNLRMWGESDVPQYNALFAVVLLAFVNLITITTAIEISIGWKLVPNTSTSKFVMISVMLGILVATFFAFVHKSKFKQIAETFSRETRPQARARLIGVWLYIATTFVGLFGLVSIRNA